MIRVYHKSKRRLSYTFVYLALGAFFVFTFAPLLWLLGLSFKTQLQAFTNPPLFIFTPTFENYETFFVESGFLKFLGNSLIVSTFSTLICLAIGSPAAYALTKIERKLKNIFLVWIILIRMVPAMTYVIPFFIVYSKSGMIDTRYGLMLSYFTLNLPLVIWLMRTFFLDVPQSSEDAARIDGASTVQAFLKIIVPLTTPGFVSTGILTFVLSWNEFIFALVLTRREAATASIAIANLMAETDWGQIAVGSIVMAIPTIFAALFIGKYLAKGLVNGGAIIESGV